MNPFLSTYEVSEEIIKWNLEDIKEIKKKK
jgi:hypothetical protein